MEYYALLHIIIMVDSHEEKMHYALFIILMTDSHEYALCTAPQNTHRS